VAVASCAPVRVRRDSPPHVNLNTAEVLVVSRLQQASGESTNPVRRTQR
jgi:hypothetical protein